MSAKKRPESMAVDGHGDRLPVSARDVDRIVQQALRDGTMRLVMLEMPGGDIAVQVFNTADGPSPRILAALREACTAYENVLRQQGLLDDDGTTRH